MVRTTIAFPVPADPKITGFAARVMIEGKEQPSVKIVRPEGPEAQIIIEAPPKARVVVFVASQDAAGNFSPATPFEFESTAVVPPVRPTNLRVVDATEVQPPAARKAIDLEVIDEAQVHNITVLSHPRLKEGSVGTVTGLDPVNRRVVHATFPNSALKYGEKPGGPGGTEFEFDVDLVGVVVVTPEQATISLAEYVAAQVELLNAASMTA